jgi:glycosyltransferase involved in cell wall biosynthesis
MKTHCAHKIHSVPLAGPAWKKRESAVPGSFYYPAAPNKHKGHLILLEAALALARRGLQFRLTFSGPGMNETGGEVIQSIRAFIEKHTQFLDDRVTIHGNAGPEEVTRLYSESACVVLPSAYEGFGLPLVEALAHGKRVIASDIPPFREQVNRYGCDRMVTFFPVRDEAALERAMAAHLNGADANGMTDEEMMDALGRWTWADVAKRCRDLLEDVTSG